MLNTFFTNVDTMSFYMVSTLVKNVALKYHFQNHECFNFVLLHQFINKDWFRNNMRTNNDWSVFMRL